MMELFRRFSHLASTSAALLLFVGCDDAGATGAGGGTGSSSATSMKSTSSGTSSSSGGGACAPPAACAAPVKDCIGYVDNTGQTKFGLRITWLDLLTPKSLDTPIVKTVIEGSALPADSSCNLNGGGTFVWLMEFDAAAGTLRTGGAKPVADVSAGFTFTNEMAPTLSGSIQVQPTTLADVKPDAQGAFASSADVDLVLPIYLDASANSSLLVPMRRVHFTMGTLSADNNCIGRYNAAGLDPGDLCLPDEAHPAFLQGGAIDGIIVLEDADTILVAPLNESLCVLLSGDPSLYGEKNGQNITVCKRTGGVIDFKGDACSMVGGSCTDASGFTANYAASSIKIN